MSFELPKTENTSQKKETLDEQWYARFEKIAAFQDYEYLNGNKEYREEQKKKFLSGEIESPELDYPELEKFNFIEKEEALLALKKDILENEKNETVRQVYHWRINEKLAELRMLKATKNKDDKKFAKYSSFIYGKPEKEMYEYTISQIKKTIDQKMFDANPQISSAAKRINKEIFEALMNNENQINSEDYNVPKIKSTVGEKEYLAEEIKKSFEAYLEKQKIEGWKVVIEKSTSTAINVSQEKKQINIPETRKLKETNLEALMEHELGTHVLRREKGERSCLKLLGLGLDRYHKGEEGIATKKEQDIKGSSQFAGFEGHLAIALATGTDGKKRNFREVFEILKDYYLITSEKEQSEALKAANNAAWTRCVRTFRGTTSENPGACFTKDIVYREGNIGVWNIVKNNPEEMKRFSVGKYDPTNPRHIWILEQLGINEGDLEELEK